MNKREFVQAHVMAAYERLITEATEVVDTTLTMRIAVNQVERAWVQLSDLGYGGKTKITGSVDTVEVIVQHTPIPRDIDQLALLDDGKHLNKSVEHWTAKLKEARGNKNSDCQDLVYLRTALTSAEVSKVMGFGYYK